VLQIPGAVNAQEGLLTSDTHEMQERH